MRISDWSSDVCSSDLMERRGAAEVVAIDIEHPEQLDWPEPRLEITDELRAHVAERKTAFDVAASALGSSVKRQWCSLYDLPTDRVGTFDFAFLGTLPHHLRDPIGALQSVRQIGAATWRERVCPDVEI